MLVTGIFLGVFNAQAQEVIQLPQKAIEKTERGYNKLLDHISGMNRKIMRRAERFEKKMYRKLLKKDPVLAKRLFETPENSLALLQNNLSQETGSNSAYVSRLDTLTGAMNFLQQDEASAKMNQTVINKSKVVAENLKRELAVSAQIKEFMRQRREILEQKLSAFSGFSKQLSRYRNDLDGYMQNIQQWKNMLNNPKQIEEKALQLVKKLPAFQQFMKEHGELAQLFGGSSNNAGNPAAIAANGLQTRAMVNSRLQGTLAAGGPNAQAAFQQQLNAAQQQLNRLKQQEFTSGSAAEMPAYGAKTMKYKRFMQRLEPGANVQFSKSNRFFPSTADVAVQLGYRFSQKGTIGLGTSYKLGFGTGWNNINFTAQGLGLRGFADFKLKGNFFINGGFEQNQLQPGNAVLLPLQGGKTFWASSALLGISKKFSAGKKLKGSAMLLYDFLYKQTPGAQPIKYRMGYYFK